MKYFASLATVFAMLVSSAQAGIITKVTENASPGAGVQSFKVTLEGTDGSLVGGFANLNITGAYQVWQNAAGNGDTPRQGDANTGTFAIPGSGAYDTFVYNFQNVNTSPGLGFVETNEGGNPAGAPLVPNDPFGTFVGTAGVGTLAMTGASPTVAFLSPNPASVDILQVVVYNVPNASARLTMDVFDAEANRTPVDMMIGGGTDIPEPSTFALVGLALVGLVGYARRRS